jgi:hypothetical protein
MTSTSRTRIPPGLASAAPPPPPPPKLTMTGIVRRPIAPNQDAIALAHPLPPLTDTRGVTPRHFR